MATLTIEIPAEAERRLREGAARRNASVETFAAELLVEQLQTHRPAEYDIPDAEIAVIREAVDDVRAQSVKD